MAYCIINKVIAYALLLLLFAQSTNALLSMDIKLISYRHGCDEDFWPVDSNCDPMFTFCVARPNKLIKFNKQSCDYSFVPESSHFQDDSYVNFQTVKNRRGVPVPWVFEVPTLLDDEIVLAVEVNDDDTVGDDDHMVTLTQKMKLSIAATKEKSKYEYFTVTSSSHKFMYGIRLYCNPHYFGSKCETKCVAQNGDNGHYTCEPSTGRKLCLKGWEGESCNVDIDECALKFCQRGICINHPGDYICYCPDYFTGRNCSIMSNPCGSNPCQRGSICDGDPNTMTYRCRCLAGWEGRHCQDKSDPCLQIPCLHSGTCQSSNNNDTYTCSCPYGWEGKNCDKRLDVCANGPCQNNGSCHSNSDDLTYICACRAGWIGKNCETKFEPCVKEPCLHEGQCNENLMTHAYLCTCVPGWKGQHCEIKTDPCLSNPCQHNGKCQSSADFLSYSCICPTGWQGKDCVERYNPCASDPCHNGASCHGNDDDLTFTCSCSSGWLGEYCDEMFQPCTSDPCLHGGQCMEDNVLYTYNCSCAFDWEGEKCEIKSNPCQIGAPCFNNGTCEARDQNLSFICLCSPYYEGDYCEMERYGERGSHQKSTQANAAFEWHVPVAVLAVALLLVVIVVFIVFRRRKNKSELQYISDALPPPVAVFQASDDGILAFENHAYTEANRVNLQRETGIKQVPVSATDNIDDLFNPIKPSFRLDDEFQGAVGGVCSDDECSGKKAPAKNSDMDNTDMKCARVSTLSRRPKSERADENPYQDFNSLKTQMSKQNASEENNLDIEEEGEEEEEDHYQTLDDVGYSVRNSRVEEAGEIPPALPPFNIGLQRNPLLDFSKRASLDSVISEPDLEEHSVSHYQEPDEYGASPDDIYSDVNKDRHEHDTLPRRPHYQNSLKPDEENDSENDPEIPVGSLASIYDVPSRDGQKSDSVIQSNPNIYDNPRSDAEVEYDVPRSTAANSGNDFNNLFVNNDPWTPDPFHESQIGSDQNNESTGPGLEFVDDYESEEENQEDILRLRQEVEDFMTQIDDKDSKQNSNA